MVKTMKDITDRYKMIYDLHTHTTYSHGKGSVEENAREAFNKGLEYIAISDHGPGHIFYGINRNEIVNIRNDIERMNVKYPKMNVKLSVEANIIKGNDGLDVTKEEFEEFDFIIAGYHFGCFNAMMIRNWLHSKGFKFGEEKLRRANTDMIVRSLKNNNISILTHPGDKAPIDIEEVARVCVETDTLMEINTWHGHLTEEEIRIVSKIENLKFIISSDAHTPNRVGDYKEGIERALGVGLNPKRIVNIKEV